MNTKFKIVIILITVLSISLFSYLKFNNEIKKVDENNIITNQEVTSRTCVDEECLKIEGLEYPESKLEKNVSDALLTALDDEYKAFATYNSVINKFGNVRPFIMIIRAEEKHISSLKSLFDKYGLQIPENKYIDSLSLPETLKESCEIGVLAEIENAKLYKENLIPTVDNYPDIKSVFQNLMIASESNHLPAFQKCSN